VPGRWRLPGASFSAIRINSQFSIRSISMISWLESGLVNRQAL
jgi:hypothetical protein